MKRRDKQLTEVELQKNERSRLEREVAIATPEATFSPIVTVKVELGPGLSWHFWNWRSEVCKSSPRVLLGSCSL